MHRIAGGKGFLAGFLVILFFLSSGCVTRRFTLYPGSRPGSGPALTREWASHFANLALKGLHQEYPNKPGVVMNGPQDAKPPSGLHPAFYGCFDWHSCVHGHWMLVTLLRRFPDLPEARAIRRALDQDLDLEKIRAEAAYFQAPNRKSFERTYGWAWLLKLAEALHRWDDPDARRWEKNLEPLVAVIRARFLDFLPRQTYPIRRGVHPNTAFGMAFALDYARATGDGVLETLLTERSRAYFLEDAAAPAAWEPDGDDFLSPSLEEADLMRRVLPPGAFAEWFHRFLPRLAQGEPASLLEPAEVSDRSDPKIVHLDGLNLSRAWCMKGIARALPEGDPARTLLLAAARRHAEATLPHVASGHYEGEHWLATFAVYMLLEGGNEG